MVSVTDIAARKIKQTLQRRGHGVGIRLGVRTTGCSGLAYVLEYVDAPKPEDQCFSCNGCEIYKAIVGMPAKDSKFLRNVYTESFPNVTTATKVACTICTTETEMEVPFTLNFFWSK